MTPNQGHGHVNPNPDGSKARCGGPKICSVCALELANSQNTAQDTEYLLKNISSGLMVRPGDTLICAMDHRISEQEGHEFVTRVQELIPGVFVLLIAEVMQIAIIPADPSQVQETVARVMQRDFERLARVHGLVPKND